MDDVLHGYGRKATRALERLPDSGIPVPSQRLICTFHDDCVAQGLSTARVEKYVRHLVSLATWLEVPFDRATLTDIKRVLHTIQASDYADWTKHDLRLVLKRFYRWLRENKHTRLDLSWVKIGSAAAKTRLPKDMPTPEDVRRMVGATKSARNKAFIMLLYETGARIGEISRLRIRDVVPHPHGLEIHLPVEGKTGARRVLAVASTPYVKKWLNEHPQAHEPEAFLWASRARGNMPRYGAFVQILRQAAAAAGINKRVNPHNFRHARATHLANHLTEAQMNQFFGWVQGSDMPSTYVHLSGRDVDAALLQSYGIQVEKKEAGGSSLTPRKCHQCKTDNPPTNSYCGLCGLPLDPEAMQATLKRNLERTRADEAMNRLIQDEQFRKLLERKLNELQPW